MRTILFFLLLFIPINVFCQGYGLNDIMGGGDQQATGITDLSSQERTALQQWISTWTVRAINQVISTGCRCTTQECLAGLVGRTARDAAAQPVFVQLDVVMNANDQQSSGVSGLSSQARDNLEEWINLWTVRAINQVIAMGCRCTAQQCLAALISGESNQYATDPFGQPIARNPVVQQEQIDFSLLTDNARNGGLILLNDGSIWQVDPNDQPRAAAWRRMDHIQTNPQDSYGHFTLVNITRNDQVGVTRPNEAVRPGNPFLSDTYRQSHTFSVRTNVNNGEVLILDNGLAYSIRLSDRDKYSKFWSAGTPVSISRKGGLYPFSLQNALTGDTVEADTRR